MNIFNNSFYPYIAIAIILAGIAYYYFVYRKKHQATKVKAGEATPDGVLGVLCRIADNITGCIYNATLSPDVCNTIKREYGTLGRQVQRDTDMLFFMNKIPSENEDGFAYKPVIIDKKVTNAPSKLHNDMQQPEVGIVMDLLSRDDVKPFLEKYGTVLWWIAVMAFFGFIWANPGG